MAQHARPHLSTHNRNQGHSAVAGAAYRLGLRLYDERQGKWHDFSKRVLGEEIVRALTVAPPGAPAWATDPAKLWNRVEAAERRKDSQVARDYRIPIPRGLTDDQAAEIAERVARFISDRLTTPVSVGLHRDNGRDALGQLKAEEEIGYHAHLYFPTRKIQCVTNSDSPDDSSGFGEKLSLLTNRTTSAQVVEMLNAAWARMSNDVLKAAGLPADRDHRSYERLGIDRKPQPKMGQAAVAMERRGFFTHKGDAVRHIMMPGSPEGPTRGPTVLVEGVRADPAVVRDALRVAQRPDELKLARERGADAEAKLADRFAYLLPIGGGISRDNGIKLLAQARNLQRSLVLLHGVGERREAAASAHALAYSTMHENHYQVDEAKRRVAAAESKVATWRAAHRFQIRWIQWSTGQRRKPKRLTALIRGQEAEERILALHNRDSQACKASLERTGVRLVKIEHWDARLGRRLQLIVDAIVAIEADAMPILLGLLPEADRALVASHLPPEPEVKQAEPDAEAPMVGKSSMQLRPRPRAS